MVSGARARMPHACLQYGLTRCKLRAAQPRPPPAVMRAMSRPAVGARRDARPVSIRPRTGVPQLNTSPKIFSIPAAVLLALLAGGALADGCRAPDELVQRAATQVLDVLRDNPQSDMHEISTLIDAHVIDHFDFGAMTHLALAEHWRQADEAQRQALTREFRTLLVRTYSAALKSFVDYDIAYQPLELASEAKRAVVQTLVSKDGGRPIQMDYRMIAREDGWKVYDVLVDGVSLVVNYRNQFGATVQKSGIDGLIAVLREKNADGPAG